MLKQLSFSKSSSLTSLSFSKHLRINITSCIRSKRISGYPSLMANLSTGSTQNEPTQKKIHPPQVFPVVNFRHFYAIFFSILAFFECCFGNLLVYCNFISAWKFTNSFFLLHLGNFKSNFMLLTLILSLYF